MRATDKGAMLAALRGGIEMTKIKLCGLSATGGHRGRQRSKPGLRRLCRLRPKSKRYVSPTQAARLSTAARPPAIQAGGRAS